MMGWNYGNMMGSGWGALGLVGFIFWMIIFVDSILLGIWLWQKIQKGKK